MYVSGQSLFMENASLLLSLYFFFYFQMDHGHILYICNKDDMVILHYLHVKITCNFLLPPGKVMFSYCLSVCSSMCLSVCMSVQAITFDFLEIETSFVVWWNIQTISWSSLSVKGSSRSRSLW